ncbi:uncharacterized protein LOC133188462 [Saccostrea echinata]|uniref:uncharacterized protein LOC133188462 n=1 Tax=Saccostrea echinata TaxID=191078 RepID=UPI002A823EED|nr:uncharacterized protein LOC133188462 [Saccostrea echinata]
MQNKLSGLSLTFRWSQIKPLPGKPLPRSRSRHSSCLHGDCVYVIGGKDGRISLKDIWKFCLETSQWERLTLKGDSLSYLEGHSLVSYKKNLLLFGGSFGDNVTDSSLWIINPDVLHVRQVSCEPGFPQPCSRRHHSAVVHDGIMYVYGGYVDLRGSSSELWAFHISEEEWELITPRQTRSDMPEGRHGHTAVLHGRNMWIYGGLSGLTPKSDLWYYNFHVGKWTRMKCRFGPPPLVGHAAAVVKDNMVLQGGEQNGELRNDFWVFSFECLKWTHVEIPNQVPSARMWHSLEAITIESKKTDGSARTSSMPYLQNKHGRRQNLRPRSSPAYSSARNRVTPKQNKENLTVNSENLSMSLQKPQTGESQPLKSQSKLQTINTQSVSAIKMMELQTKKSQTDSIPVVMRTPTPKQKEEKSPLLLERHISQCSEGSQSSLKGADNLGMDISSSSDGISSLDFTSCKTFTQSYGYHQKPPERVKPVKMQTFSHNVINVLPYPQLTQDLVVEDLEIYENYFSELNETAFVKRECQKNHFGGYSKKYKVNKMEIKNLRKRSSNYSTNDMTLDRYRSSSVGELRNLNEKVSETKTALRSKSLHNLKKDSPVLCWQSEDSDQATEEVGANPATNVEMTTDFSEPVNKETVHENQVISNKKVPPNKKQETRIEIQELAQPYLLLFGGKDMNGGSVWLESLTAWRCEVFVRHSDISHGEFHKSSLII